GCGADENSEPADARVLAPGGLEQGLRRRPLIRIAPRICHLESASASGRYKYYRAVVLSRARLSASTLTRGSPSKPRKRDSVWSPTSWRTRSSGRLRALATRGTWNNAAAGEMCGSSPPPEVVTRSIGTCDDPCAPGFSCLSLSTSACTRSISALLVGP